MRGRPTTGEAGSGHEVSVEVGMRRISWVRIVVTDAGAECEAVGVGHRLPTVHRVSLDTAVALAGTGVPAIVRVGAEPARKLLAVG